MGQLVHMGALPQLSCSTECVKAQLYGQVGHHAGCCGVYMVQLRFFSLLVSVVKSPHLVSGLVEEDITRLRVLGDFRSETVKFFYGLCINFLQEYKGDM